MSQIYFTSDLHFGHDLVATRHRGFPDTMTHDSTVIHNWSSVVKPRDVVYVLGDIVGDTRQTEYALGIIDSLPGSKHLIAGNHDQVSSIHRNGWKHQRQFLKTFESVRDFARIQHSKRHLMLSHYPYVGDNSDHTEVPRYGQYRLTDVGTPLLHGHTHIGDQQLHLSAVGTPQVHIGLDAWDLTPVSLDTVSALMASALELPSLPDRS